MARKKITPAKKAEIKQWNADQATHVANTLLEKFKTGDVHKSVSYILLKNKNIPAQNYSLLNQMLVFIVFECTDARGYNDWKKVGRQVQKGSTYDALIRFPKFRKVERVNMMTGKKEEVREFFGTGWTKIFDISSTEGDAVPYDEEQDKFIDELPLIDVARAQGITVTTGHSRTAAASINIKRKVVTMSVTDKQTWLHELMHFADSEVQGGLKGGQQVDQEIVAEFGSAVLASCLGIEVHDKSTFDYITAYASRAGMDAGKACEQLLARTVKAVDFLMKLSADKPQAAG